MPKGIAGLLILSSSAYSLDFLEIDPDFVQKHFYRHFPQ
jgi:hypothetical protein